MRFKVRESDMEILEAAAGHQRTEILANIAATIEKVVKLNHRYIKEQPNLLTLGEKYPLDFRVSRSYKLPGRSKGINLFYTLIREKDEIKAFVSTKRSKWSKQNEYSAEEVHKTAITDEMDRILMID